LKRRIVPCATRQAVLIFFELVHPVKPQSDHMSISFASWQRWEMIADLMINAAVNHERSNGNDMGIVAILVL